MNFCISHRNEMDHECKGLRPGPAQARRSSVNAAVRRAMAMVCLQYVTFSAILNSYAL